MTTITIDTDGARTAIDVTDRVVAAAPALEEGLLLVTCPHTSAAIFLCEADDELLEDFADFSEKWLAQFEPFKHTRNDNPNAAAHITSAVFGGQVLVLVKDGRPVLGTYQRLVFLELDGPKQRHVDVVGIGVALQGTVA